MLVLEVVYDVLFGMLLQRLDSIKIARPFIAFDWNFEITATIKNPNRIPIGLCIIYSKPLEL